MIQKIFNFTRSLISHIRKGAPKSSQQLIDHRYSICLDCDSFNSKDNECGVCGCNINNQKIFMNKLAWKDQTCPLNKW